MKIKIFKAISVILRVIMILLASALVFNGIMTMFSPLTHVETLGWLYETRAGLVVAGAIIAGSGLTLLIGKAFNRNHWVSNGLIAIFCCYLFATITNTLAFGFMEAGIGNAILAVIVAALYLWWRFKVAYISKHVIYDQLVRDFPELRP